MTAPTRNQTAAPTDETTALAADDAAANGVESAERDIDTSRELPSLPGLPVELKQALRAGRTPLIEGIDYKQTPIPYARPVENPRPETPAQEKQRVDTLSPAESVPPPAPFLAAPLQVRPAVVPPVRSPYVDPPTTRGMIDAVPKGLIRSEPPPRIPISDRPSRLGYHSEPPPRLSNSDPPPSMAAPSSSKRRPSRRDFNLGESPEALRREAVTIPADVRSPPQPPVHDPSKPLPALRPPTFAAAQLPYAIRQHENNQLRYVAMSLMFVIFIVTGAIAGMRWFVAREDERGPRAIAPASSFRPMQSAPTVPELAAQQPGAVEARLAESTPEIQPAPAPDRAQLQSPPTSGKPQQKLDSERPPAKALRAARAPAEDPWAKGSQRVPLKGKSRTGIAEGEVDTQTPLFAPRK
ncbi:MAG: hypothetical protein ACM3ZE_15600 [Myxococcales bacterium]